MGINLRWQWRTAPIAVTPFVGYYFPSNDYPLFTETQAGTQQWRADFGVNLAGRLGPPRLNLTGDVDGDAVDAVEALESGAYTGQPGDGRILVAGHAADHAVSVTKLRRAA